MTALMVAGAIASGTGAWAIARVVDVTSTPAIARTAPIEAISPPGKELAPVDAPTSTTQTQAPAAPDHQVLVPVWHPAPRAVTAPVRSLSPAPPPPPAPEPAFVAPVVAPPVPSCHDDGCGSSSGGSSGDHQQYQSGGGSPAGSGTSGSGSGTPTGTGTSGTGTHHDD